MSTPEHELRARLRRIYVDGWAYWEDPASHLAHQEDQVEALRQAATRLLGCPASVQTRPRDINNYYEIECPLRPGLPASRSQVKLYKHGRTGPIEYLQLLASVVAPVVAGVWHRFNPSGVEPRQEIFDLLSDEWFATHPDHESVARELIRTAEAQGLSVLGWDVTLQPAGEDWPRSAWMPEHPDLRHYLFKGYYDDWGGIIKPVRDTP